MILVFHKNYPTSILISEFSKSGKKFLKVKTSNMQVQGAENKITPVAILLASECKMLKYNWLLKKIFPKAYKKAVLRMRAQVVNV